MLAYTQPTHQPNRAVAISVLLILNTLHLVLTEVSVSCILPTV